MDYRGSLKAMYNNPNWLVQTSLIGLCALIPIVGPIAVMGYMFESAAYLHLTNREGYPDFSFGRFGPYLARGVGPFLVSLLFLIVFVPLVVVEQIVAVAVAALLASMQIPGLVQGFGLMLSVIFFVVNGLLFVVQWSLWIRGGLSGELGDSFRFGFIGEFMKRSGADGFWAYAWINLTLIPCAYCFMIAPQLLMLTIFPAIGVIVLCYAWLSCQLYRSYLTEKGMPFRVKCDVIEEG
jgi:hypothetical protein